MVFSVSRVVLSLEELCLCQSFARKSMCRSNVTAPVSWSIISCSDSTCFFPSGIQTVGNYFSMCKSLVAWILGRNWGRLKRRKVRLWIACRKLNYISVWILKRWFFFFWESSLSLVCIVMLEYIWHAVFPGTKFFTHDCSLFCSNWYLSSPSEQCQIPQRMWS